MNTQINLPAYEIKIRKEGEIKQIFDPIRKKYVALTPEEWVRQHFINLLVTYKKYPRGLLAIEHPVKVNNMQQRVDIVAFNKQGKPMLIVECKAPDIQLTRKTYEQAARYNLTLKANYLVVTNGITHLCSRIDNESKKFYPLQDIPEYNLLCAEGKI
ncbi:MAG: type I restriction enzyme HsdR N-terminal domain-containing protein [Bacteroidales bacterium]